SLRAASAASYSCGPCAASSALFAVTTLAPEPIASRMSFRAGSMPPSSSTTRSARRTRPGRSSVSSSLGTTGSRGVAVERTPMPTRSRCVPVRECSSSACSTSERTTSVPTTPQPSTATRTLRALSFMLSFRCHAWRGPSTRARPTIDAGVAAARAVPQSGRLGSAEVEGQDVLDRLPTEDLAGFAVPDRHHPRTRQQVVLAGHRAPVGAGGGHGEQVTSAYVPRELDLVHQDVTALAVLAHHPGQHRLGRRRADQSGVVLRVVERGSDVVAHPAVHGHV